jgi:hypothetical protein
LVVVFFSFLPSPPLPSPPLLSLSFSSLLSFLDRALYTQAALKLLILLLSFFCLQSTGITGMNHPAQPMAISSCGDEDSDDYDDVTRENKTDTYRAGGIVQ